MGKYEKERDKLLIDTMQAISKKFGFKSLAITNDSCKCQECRYNDKCSQKGMVAFCNRFEL